MKFFTHFGANFCRASFGVTLIFDPDDQEYAFGLFFGPLLFLCGWEAA